MRKIYEMHLEYHVWGPHIKFFTKKYDGVQMPLHKMHQNDEVLGNEGRHPFVGLMHYWLEQMQNGNSNY